ncbi:MAG TPA: ice-binding family protein [Polyangiales bacterium]
MDIESTRRATAATVLRLSLAAAVVAAGLLLLCLVSACAPSHARSAAADAASLPGEGGNAGADGASATADGGGSVAHGGGSATHDGGSATHHGGNATHDGGVDGGIDAGVAPGLVVELGSAGDYAILAKSGISSVPTSAVTGNIGVSPAAASYITGFSLSADATKVFSTSVQVTGKVYAANYAVPTPSKLTTAVSDMQLAFTAAAGRAPSVTELGAGNIGGKTLAPGVYKWGTGLLIPTNVTLNGSATDVWIFQIAKDLTVSNGTKVVLGGGALPKNVFWQVAGKVAVGTTAHFEGIVLCQTSIALRTGASINGRLLAQTAVSLDASTVTQPAP